MHVFVYDICESYSLSILRNLNSIIGAMIMVGGVYLVVWCKMKESKGVSTTPDHIEKDENIKEVKLGDISAVNNRDVP